MIAERLPSLVGGMSTHEFQPHDRIDSSELDHALPSKITFTKQFPALQWKPNIHRESSDSASVTGVS